MAVQERPGGLGRVCFDETPVAVGQIQDEVVGLLLHPADDHQGLAEVALGMAWRLGERHEHLPRPAAVLPHIVLDRGVSTAKPVLVPQPLEDALRGVALLLGDVVILLQDLADDSGIGLQLGTLGRALPPVARRHRIGQHLAHRVPVQPERPRRLPEANPLHHHCHADPQIYVHSVHPSHHP